jgi:outer membrane protein TolC
MIKLSRYCSFLLAALLFFILKNASAQDPKIITLQDCWESAEKFHALQKEKAFLSEVLELRLENIHAGWLPKADVFAQATFQSDVITIDPGISIPGLSFPSQKKDQYKLGLDLQQVIYEWGVTRARKEVESANIRAQQAGLDVSIYKLREMVSQLFFSIAINQENLKILELFHSELLQRMQVVQSGIENGVVQESALWQLEIEELKLKQKISESSHLNKNLFDNLSEITGMNLAGETEILLPDSQPVGEITNGRKEYEWFDLIKTGFRENEKLLTASRRPKLAAFAQAGYGRPGLNMLSEEFDTYYLVGVRLGWTLTDWKQSRREKQILGIQQQVIDSRRESFDQALRMSLNNELSAISMLNEAIINDKIMIELREKLLRVYTAKLDRGTIQPVDYLAEFNALLEAKIQLTIHEKKLIQAQVNYIVQSGSPMTMIYQE